MRTVCVLLDHGVGPRVRAGVLPGECGVRAHHGLRPRVDCITDSRESVGPPGCLAAVPGYNTSIGTRHE